ncbi:MAG: hypothetical protein ACOC80_13145 [Petrotogales bacterium]
MNLTELIVVLFICGLLLSIVGININAISRAYNITFSKIKFDCFLEEVRYRAINKSRRINIYYQKENNSFITSDGEKFLDFKGYSSNNAIFGFNKRGSLFIVSGSTSFYFEDNSKLTILPVTGQLRY